MIVTNQGWIFSNTVCHVQGGPLNSRPLGRLENRIKETELRLTWQGPSLQVASLQSITKSFMKWSMSPVKQLSGRWLVTPSKLQGVKCNHIQYFESYHLFNNYCAPWLLPTGSNWSADLQCAVLIIESFSFTSQELCLLGVCLLGVLSMH